MKDIERLERINPKLYDLVKYIEIEFNNMFYIENSKVYIDEFSFEECFIQFDFKRDFHFIIKFRELEDIINSGMRHKTYISGLYFQVEQSYLKETIKK